MFDLKHALYRGSPHASPVGVGVGVLSRTGAEMEFRYSTLASRLRRVAWLIGLISFIGSSAPAQQAPQQTRTISHDECMAIVDRWLALVELEKAGKRYFSRTARRGLSAFFVFGADDRATCTGPRIIPWENNDNDYNFIVSIAAGIRIETVRKIRAMGIRGAEEIIAIARDASSLQIDIDEGSIALAMMKSDDPKNYQGHVEFFRKQYGPKSAQIEILNIQIKLTEIDTQLKKLQNTSVAKVKLIKQRDELRAELERIRELQRAYSTAEAVGGIDFGIRPATQPIQPPQRN